MEETKKINLYKVWKDSNYLPSELKVWFILKDKDDNNIFRWMDLTENIIFNGVFHSILEAEKYLDKLLSLHQIQKWSRYFP